MRDTYYILTAFNNIGHFEEMEQYFHYIANISTKAQDKFQPLYAISGASELIEQELDLEGYLGNKPVRIGNDAYTHIQNDVYGQVLVALLPLYVDRRFIDAGRVESEKLIYDTLHKLEKYLHEARRWLVGVPEPGTVPLLYLPVSLGRSQRGLENRPLPAR